MDSQNQRNMILAVLLTALILFGWDAGMRYMYPHANKAQPAAAASATPAAPAPASSTAPKPTREGGLTDAADQALEAKDLQTALNPASRVPIQAPGLSGSINLAGGVVDAALMRIGEAEAMTKDGKYRILVGPDKADDAWPKALRVGGGAVGFALALMLNRQPRPRRLRDYY